MLHTLRIENFALIDRLELEFAIGLNVLTGETGAGKSIILDGIDTVLGGKVTSRAIRTGAKRALLEASFSLDPHLEAWLAAQEIEPLEDRLVCSREIVNTQGGLRSRSRLNGVLVNKQQIESLRDRLVEITAQGQAVQLGQSAMQREWLDSFGGPELLQQRAIVSAAFTAWQQARQALDQYRQSEQQRLQQLDLLEYQARELGAANLQDPDELEQLDQEEQRLSHSVELQQQSYQTYQILYHNEHGELACADLLGQAEATLELMSRHDRQVQPILDLVSDALAQVEEAGRQINAYGEALETDPQRLEAVAARLMELKQICRKYGPTLAEAIAYYQRTQAELEALNSKGQSLEDLEQNYRGCQATLTQACAQLTQLRQAAAEDLEARIIGELKPLAMEKVQFCVAITAAPAAIHGADAISFLFSPNPGEPLQPLTEIASGGEMSRFLLALQACFSQVDPVGTLIFDEIDVGVSGRVVQAIAQKFYQLSQHHQVLCVTHQPIVAAMADSHFRVEKQITDQASQSATQLKTKTVQTKTTPATSEAIASEGESHSERTVIRVTTLQNRQRQEELAQLAGGHSAKDAMAFADSLLHQAAQIRLVN
jgi:DNA repair protein RecN (Recombination protein N)